MIKMTMITTMMVILLLVNAALPPLPAQSFPQHQHDDDGSNGDDNRYAALATQSFPQSPHQQDCGDNNDDDNCDQAYNKKYFQVDPLAAGDSNVDIEVIKFVANMARVCPSVH